jgi:hypothetical protein
MAITGPTDKTTIHVSQAQKFQRYLHVDEDALVQLDLVDTGKVTTDGLKIFAMGTVPTALPGSSSKLSPSSSELDVAAAGTAETLAKFIITGLDVPTQAFEIAGDWTKYFKAGDTITIAGSTANDGTYIISTATYATGTTTIVVDQLTYPIVGLVQVAKTFDITGDYASSFGAGDSITIEGSTGNDGTYTIASATYDVLTNLTTVEVNEAIVDATIDGTIYLLESTIDGAIYPVEMLVMSLVIQAKSTNAGDIIPGDSDIAAGLGFTLAAKDRCSFSGDGYPLDLADFFIDVSVNGDGVTWYILG